jgi:limonene-1,2-epoxide hydrolase
MGTVLRVWTQEEVRSVIRFLWAKGTVPIEIHREIQAVYGSNVMTKRFKSHADVKQEVQTWLRGQDPTFYRQGFEKWNVLPRQVSQQRR